MIKPQVLFLCSDNSCRMQMAEAFLRDMAGDRFKALSAGGEATALDPDALAVMREAGLDISGQTPKKVDQFMGERVAFLITLCEREKERTCPIVPGATWRHKRPLDNPASALDGERRTVTRRVRDERSTALAQLNAGETVFDLGSGGGIDVLLSARHVGPAGKAYGLGITDETLSLARENQRKAGVENVEFLKGEIEHIPLPDNSVDVVISNCVINLPADCCAPGCSA